MKPTENGQGWRQAKAADHEAARARSRPEKVGLLFVGESPPASGRFFYNRDSGLYRAMLGAFHAVDHAISDDNFLDVFQKTGCYLTDACRRPVDRLDLVARRDACSAGEKTLASRIRKLQPGIDRLLLSGISGQRPFVGVGEAFDHRKSSVGRVDVHVAGGGALLTCAVHRDDGPVRRGRRVGVAGDPDGHHPGGDGLAERDAVVAVQPAGAMDGRFGHADHPPIGLYVPALLHRMLFVESHCGDFCGRGIR